MEGVGTAWRRGTLAAGGAAVLAPLAVVGAALAVGIGGGGAGVGALGQVLSGPAMPAERAGRSDDGGRERDRRARRREADPGELLVGLAPDGGGGGGGAATGGAVGGGGSGGSRPDSGGEGRGGGGRGRGQPGSPGTGTPGAAPTPTPGSGGGGGGGGGGTTPAPEPTPAPGPVGQIGDGVGSLLEPLPVVGPTAGGVVEGVTDGLDGILTP